MHDDGYKFLVQETLNLLNENQGRNPFDDFDEYPPTTPGLIYYIQKGTTTFLIKMVGVENVGVEWEQIFSGKSGLPFDFLEQRSLLRYFATPYKELSEHIIEQLQQRRFPLNEELLSHLTTPSFNWWGRFVAGTMTISYRFHLPDNDTLFTKLGPIGETAVAYGRFKVMINELHPLFCFKEIQCDERSFSLSPQDSENPHFKRLQKVFLNGEFPTEFGELLKKYLSDTSYYYLQEVAALRRFWAKVEFSLALPPSYV